MPAGRLLKRSYNVLQLGLQAANATTGVWTFALSSAAAPSGAVTLNKAAAATNSVLNLQVPNGINGLRGDDSQVSIIEVFYQVTTANLTSAPTAVINRMTYPGGTGTGLVALATVTQVLSFAGVDTVGTAAGAGATGSHIAVVTISTPFTPADTETLHLKLTMNEAATSVLDIHGMTVTYI